MESAGCASYNEMIQKKDKGLLSAVSNHAFVCFRKGEDAFVTVSYHDPLPAFFSKDAEKGILKQIGTIRYATYKNGVQEIELPISGFWTKAFPEDAPVFTPRESEIQATVNDGEVSYSYPYPNLGGTTTHYMIRIRRSTLRFVETYEAHRNDKKSTTTDQMTNTGYCVEFQSP